MTDGTDLRKRKDVKLSDESMDSGIASSTSNTPPSTPSSPASKKAPLTQQLDSTQPGDDHRHPLYLGTWDEPLEAQMQIKHDALDEPHMKRKLAILKKHPEIKELYGYEWKTKWLAGSYVLIQWITAWFFSKHGPGYDWRWTMVAWAWVVGGYLTQVLGLIIHECSHNLTASTPFRNRLVGFLCNGGIIFPIAAGFKRYHLEHHSHQGVTKKDPDLPMDWELKIVRSGSTFSKMLWMFCYPILYVVRGLALGKSLSKWELINAVFTVCMDVFLLSTLGVQAFMYLFMSLWFGYGLHPAAAHFIQEHYVFEEGQETYSYYGSFNKTFINIGYHNEHHDFNRIPWSKLPEVRRLAPEFYDTIAHHTSWWRLLYNFMTNKNYGPNSRCGRTLENHTKGRKMLRNYL